VLLARQLAALLVVLALGAGPAMSCKKTFVGLLIDQPAEGELFDEDPILFAARVGRNFDETTLSVELDGTDLIAALGLVPPFQGAGGNVLLGSGDVVTVSDFEFSTTNPSAFLVSGSVVGLAIGPHTLEVVGLNQTTSLFVSDLHPFERLLLFQQAAPGLAAAALPFGPDSGGVEGTLANASLAAPLAGPPVFFADGSELRAGLVEAAEGAIASGGSP